MNWKILLPLPLAAFLLGTPMQAPKRLPPLLTTEAPCPRQAAELYLRAYAYAAEDPFAAQRLLGAADAARQVCAEDTTELGTRINKLKKALFP